MELNEVVKLLLEGKQVYYGSCLNADIDSIPMVFENDREAINYFADYEAETYKYILENDYLSSRCIYDPFDCFG